MINIGARATVLLGTICLTPLLVGWSNPATAAKCQVTGGANKGKTGVFTDGGTWCSGKWGSTECNGNSGSRCKAAKATVVDNPGNVTVFDGVKSSLVNSYNYFDTPDHGLVGCTIATPTNSGVAATAICEPVVMELLDNLKGSDSEDDRRNAVAVSNALRSLPPR
jgi:hypothetical protein